MILSDVLGAEGLDEIHSLVLCDTKAREGYYLEDCRLVYFHYSTMLNGLPEDGVYNTNGL